MEGFHTRIGRHSSVIGSIVISLLFITAALLIATDVWPPLTGMGLISMLGLLLWTLIDRRKQMHQTEQLQQVNQQLEQHIEDRTAKLERELGDRRWAEEQLRQQNAQLAELAEHNAQLLEAEQRARRTAETLRAASSALVESLDLDLLLERFFDAIHAIVPYDGTVLFLYEDGQLRARAARGYEPWGGIEQVVESIGQPLNTVPNLQYILAQQESILVPDRFEDKNWIQHHGSTFFRSWLGVPLILGRKVIGIYSFDKLEANFFTTEHLQLTEPLASQAAIAIENARLFHDAQRRAREAETLREAGAVVASALNQEEALPLILEQLKRVVQFDEASVMLIQDDQLVSRATMGDSWCSRHDSELFPIDRPSGAGLVIQRRAPVLIGDVTNSPDWLPVPEPTMSWLGVPLMVKGEVIGVLNIGAFTKHRFTQHDSVLAVSFASHAVVAIENARLFEDAQRRAHEAETLREAGAVVAATLQKEEAINLILDQLQRVIPHDCASVQLLSESGHELVVVGGHGTGYDPLWTGATFPIPGPNPNTIVIREQRSYLIDDVDQFYPAFKREEHGLPIRSWLGVPLIVRGRIIGMLTIDKFERRYFTQDHERLASAFADQVAIAIERANLFSSAQQEIAERRRAEEQLRQAKEEAEAATRTKSEFLATMSHEIRTPMNGVLGLADVLLDTPLGVDQRQVIEMIRTSGDGLLRVIDDILDFSKIEAGRLEIEQQPFNLRDCLKAALDIVRPHVIEKGLTLNAQLDPSAPMIVTGDPTRLQQILFNLLGNAIKFTEQGEVELTMSCERQEHDPSQYRIFCTVRDTGVGIPAEGMERLFQSFSQGDASMTRRYGGTGLGLAICKLLCELMGGEIWAESTPGEGSIFCFTLLVGAAEQPEQRHDPNADAAPASDGHTLAARLPLRVLLAEDNPINQYVATMMLQRLGYTPDVANNGNEVLAALSAQAYDLVLMDMQMPDMDGLEATRQIRAQQHTAQPIIIALTANAMQGDRERCLAAGMNDYLSKPVRQHELRRMIERWANHFQFTPPPPIAAEPARLMLDQQMIDEMRAAGALDDLIALFQAETPGLLTEIRAAIERADAPALRHVAHTLKSTCGYLGASGMAKQALALQQAAEVSDFIQAPHLSTILEQMFGDVMHALYDVQENVR